jgi:hypothetical protein
MLAVLQNGIESYLGPEGRIRTEAECWLTTPGRRSPFSFPVVCETLGLEPDAVRRALRRLRGQRLPSSRAIGRLRPNARQARHRLAG